MTLEAVDRISVTTVVDNSVDSLRADEKVARRWTHTRARKMPTLRAEHGLAHWVEVTRGRETRAAVLRLGAHRRVLHSTTCASWASIRPGSTRSR